jgi:arginase
MIKSIEIHGVPMDLGANLRGVDMGPSALRIAGIERALESLGYDVVDNDTIHISSRVALPPDTSNAKYMQPITEVCQRLYDVAKRAKQKSTIPLFLGGDHSIAMGTVAGVAGYYKDRGEHVGLIWFDAHTDMNVPESSPTGNVHGMPLAALLGIGPEPLTMIGGWKGKVRPENVFVIGARDVDACEKSIVYDSGVTVFSMKEVDALGMRECARQAIEGASRGTSGIHLSFDIDGLDPEVAPGVGTPVRGGISFREAHLFMELIADSGRMVAMDVVELNPIRDLKNSTAEAVVHLVQSAFGRSIL